MAPVPIVPIGVLLGKADTAFKLVGGSSIVFNLIRSRIFGKVLRAVEYPDGELHHVKIYGPNLYTLKSLIADTQPPPFPTAFLEPEDVKQISVFTSPHFTEAVQNDSDVSSLPDNAWLLWSKDAVDERPIPTRGVKLDGSHVKGSDTKAREEPGASEARLQDEAIQLARRIHGTKLFSRWQFDRLVDLAVDRDAGLLTIAKHFRGSEAEFRTHCVRLLRRRDPRSILVGGGEGAAGGGEGGEGSEGEGADQDGRRSAEAQVELSSRE